MSLLVEESIALKEPLKGVRVTYAGPSTFTLEDVRKREKEAYQSGYAAAEQYLNMQILEYRKELHSLEGGLLKNVDTSFNEMVETVQARIPGLAIQLVKKVWSGLMWDGDAVRGMVEEILAEYCTGKETVEVFLSASDLHLLEGFEEDTPYGKVVLKEDMTLKPGDCLVQTKFGLIDARLETKFKKIEKELGGTAEVEGEYEEEHSR